MNDFLSNLSTYIFWILYVYIIISIIVVILLENRNPAKSLIWVLVLIFLPVIGIIFYAFVGQDFRRKKIISKKSLHRLNVHANFDYYRNREQEKDDLPVGVKHTIMLLEKNAEAPVYGQSKIDVFTSGAETFEAMFADMEAAKEHIHVESYIVEPDEIGHRFRDLLIKKAKEGVRVRFIYDYLGGFGMKKRFLKPLKEAGVYLHAFLPAIPYAGLSKVNYRNHRKLVVVDGKVGYTGGVNVADRYIKGNNLGLWRDTQVRFEGAAVHGLQNAFLIDWFFVSQKLISDLKYYPKPKTFPDLQNLVQIVGSGPDTDFENVMQGIVSMITSAQKYIYIHTPYFLPTEAILSVLQIASLSGVDVRLMLPEKSDTHFAQMATKSYLLQILGAGVRVFFYRKAFLHSKAIVVDDLVSTVGTSNMDFRSYEQNFELNAFIYDKKTASTLREAFENDLKQCKEITIEGWKRRKKKERLKDSFARLFSPLL